MFIRVACPILTSQLSLAYAELYMTLATIFRRFELELFETTRETVQYSRDYFNSFPEKGCDGVKVMIHQPGCGTDVDGRIGGWKQ